MSSIYMYVVNIPPVKPMYEILHVHSCLCSQYQVTPINMAAGEKASSEAKGFWLLGERSGPKWPL